MATWNNSDEESTEEDQAHEMSNLALMAIGDELDEVNLPHYDKLLETFKELHSDLKKFGFKKASPKENFITQVKMIIYKSKIVL